MVNRSIVADSQRAEPGAEDPARTRAPGAVVRRSRRDVTDVGCLMHPSTPFKIEKGDPPRRITIDEFVGFSKVFGLSLDELLVPPDVAEDAAITELVQRFGQVLVEAREPLQQLSAIRDELATRAGAVEVLEELVRAQLQESGGPPRIHCGSARPALVRSLRP